MKLYLWIAVMCICLFTPTVECSRKSPTPTGEGFQNRNYKKICESIARDIESLKTEFPQLTKFTVSKNLTGCLISYNYKVHRSSTKGGWKSGMPEPDADGIVLYIEMWDEKSANKSQLSIQMTQPLMYIGQRRVTYMLFEGGETKPVSARISEILEKHGLKVKGRSK